MPLLSPDERRVRMREWLVAFRAATPRARRQGWVDGIAPATLLDELAEVPTLARPRGYYLALYLLGARFLQDPACMASLDREALLRQLATMVGLRWTTARADMETMLWLLRRSHQHWQRHWAPAGPLTTAEAPVLEIVK